MNLATLMHSNHVNGVSRGMRLVKGDETCQGGRLALSYTPDYTVCVYLHNTHTHTPVATLDGLCLVQNHVLPLDSLEVLDVLHH